MEMAAVVAEHKAAARHAHVLARRALMAVPPDSTVARLLRELVHITGREVRRAEAVEVAA